MMFRGLFFVALCTLSPTPLSGQEEGERDHWEPLRFLVGAWQGRETGSSGVGTGEREYEFIMGETYLFAHNTSTFEPQPANPEGEVHRDWAIFSYDRVRETLVLREFHSEGFVNQYSLDASNGGDRFVLTSESLENLPSGWRARITLTIQDTDTFDEVFELAAPGKEYDVLLENHWTRR
jgi:hypothetical protein